MDRPPLFIIGMQGLGDCINQRPIVRAVSKRVETYLATPWPQLYGDLEVKCVKGGSRLRTQYRNESQMPNECWHPLPAEVGGTMRLWYRTEYGNLHEQFERLLPLSPDQQWRYDLPYFDRPRVAPTRPYAVVRPATVRREWRADARNPKPEYLERAAAMLRDRGIAIVTIASLQDGEEWLIGKAPVADMEFLNGELTTNEMLGLIQHATLCVGGEGFLMPAAMAFRTPIVVIYGGWGGHGHPDKTIPPRLVDSAPYATILPDNFCLCQEPYHDCDKLISEFDGKFAAALTRLRARGAALVA